MPIKLPASIAPDQKLLMQRSRPPLAVGEVLRRVGCAMDGMLAMLVMQPHVCIVGECVTGYMRTDKLNFGFRILRGARGGDMGAL